MTQGDAIVFVMLAIIGAALAMMWMAMGNRRRVREIEHRERLAMIERGLVPPPELDPAAFERSAKFGPAESRGAIRSRSAGVMLIGFGLALMLLITYVANAPDVGIGIGGAFALMGGAFLFNSMLLTRGSYDDRAPVAPPRRPASGGPEPPGTMGP